MEHLKPQIHLEELGSEVRSYIYQIITEFHPFSTPETIVAVVAKDPLKIMDRDNLKSSNVYRIAISLTEEGTKIEEEAVHEDIYEAIRLAKEKLLKTLTEIQDKMITSSDRHQQIKDALTGSSVH